MWMTRVSITHPVFATMVMIGLTVLGLFSYARLGVEPMPDVSPPGVQIWVNYPGASPEQVENDLAKPIESAANTVAGVKRILSRSDEGRSLTWVEFRYEVDMDRAIQEVRDKLAQISFSLMWSAAVLEYRSPYSGVTSCVFRTMLTSHSGAKLPAVPEHGYQ